MSLKFFSLFLSVVLVSACGGTAAQGAADYATAVQYMRGDGVERNEQKAMAYLSRAVSEENP
jgi:TPR repeat protein